MTARHDLNLGCEKDEWEKAMLRQLVVMPMQCNAECVIDGEVDKTRLAKV